MLNTQGSNSTTFASTLEMCMTCKGHGVVGNIATTEGVDTCPDCNGSGNTFDIMMPFYFNGTDWTFSLYTLRDDIDCSAIAKRYQGGGHVRASGFKCDHETMIKIISGNYSYIYNQIKKLK